MLLRERDFKLCCCIYGSIEWSERTFFWFLDLGYYFLSIPSKLIIQKKEIGGLVKDRKVQGCCCELGIQEMNRFSELDRIGFDFVSFFRREKLR